MNLFSTLLVTVALKTSLQAAEPLLVEKLEGPITTAEVLAFKSFMREVPVPKDNLRNAMVYGTGGMAVESLGRVFEMSGDRELLDLMMRFTDAMLAGRNDPKTGLIVWTGEREAVWPNSVPKDGQRAYAGTETGDVIGHIAYAARLVLQNKSLHDQKVPDGDPHGFGATYRQRAERYVREMDHTVDAFVLRWLVRADTQRYYSPDSPAYDEASRPDSSNKPVPWNQQMMLNNGFQRLAECHALLGDDAARLKRYDAIVQVSVDWFFATAKRITVNGHECYRWTYALEEPMKHFEDIGHGGYDVGGLYRAYASGRYGITSAMMKPFANTVLQVMARPNHTFTDRTDGQHSGKRPPGTLRGSWIDLCEFAPELLPILHTANRGRIKGSADTTANLLWVRHRLAMPTAHLQRLSDKRGISEFATGIEPLRDRFCIEDTARALVAVLKTYQLQPSESAAAPARLYLDAIEQLTRPDGGFWFGYQGETGPMNRHAEGDNFTRVLWGLGHASAYGVDDAMKARAARMFETALSDFDPTKRQPMSQAYAIQGLHEFLKAKPDHAAARKALMAASESLLQQLPAEAQAAWPWPGKVVTYDSARLPLALLLAVETTHEERFRIAGMKVLEFLANVNFPGDGKMLHVIGNKDWYREGQPPSAFDQQPIDASSLVEACSAAWRITKDAKWKERSVVSLSWFTGNNVHHISLYDPTSGGCRDALGRHGVNPNQGAESTLSYWIARGSVQD